LNDKWAVEERFMNQRIVEELHQIEAAHGIKVLYACESGSRAWGFPSADSDYDVRFLYLHPREHYLSIDIEHRRDVIERPISEMLDINGWDLRKALQLLRKSNPPLLEWLQSPIIYLDRFEVAAALRRMLTTYHSPIACAYHYLSMARNDQVHPPLKGSEERTDCKRSGATLCSIAVYLYGFSDGMQSSIVFLLFGVR